MRTRAAVSKLFFSFVVFVGCITALHAENAEYIRTSLDSGIFSQNQILSVAAEENIQHVFFFEESKEKNPVPYTFPLELTAMAGEERSYTVYIQARRRGVILQEKVLNITIDKSVPEIPEPSIPSGSYPSEISIDFSNRKNGETVMYAIDTKDIGSFIPYEGKPLKLGAEGMQNSAVPYKCTVYAFSVDRAGNQSVLGQWDYVFEKPIQPSSPENLLVLSPVPGSFCNRQLLAIYNPGYEWIKYSVDGKDPEQHGVFYFKPVMLDVAGSITLKVVGKPKGTDALLRKEVTFSVLNEKTDVFAALSGVFENSLNLAKRGDQEYFYCFEERRPGKNDRMLPDSLWLSTIPGGVRYATIRIVPRGLETLGSEFRYFYVLDDSKVSPPEIMCDAKLPSSSSVFIRFTSQPDADVYYTIDGSLPDSNSLHYTKPFMLPPPAGKKTATVTILAKAITAYGKQSSTAKYDVQFDLEEPEMPAIDIVSLPQGAVELRTGEKGNLVYEIAYGDAVPPDPDMRSQRLSLPAFVSVPYGMERTLSMKISRFDEAKNVSKPFYTGKIVLDHYPPKAPVLIPKDGIVEIQGEGTIFYVMTVDGSQPSFISGEKTPYVRPIPITGKPNEIITYRISALSEDASGNLSPLSEPFLYTIDKRIPRFAGFSGVEQDRVYKDESVELSVRLLDEATELRYTVTNDGTEPPEPTKDSRLAEGKIKFEGTPGERTAFQVKITPYFKNGSIPGETVSVRFVLDLDPPQILELNGIEQDKVYNSGTLIQARTKNSDDKVFISVTENSKQFVDPLGPQGIELPFFLSVPENSEKTFFISIAAVDAAGNTVYVPEQYICTIDRKPPEPPVVMGIPEQGITARPVIITMQSDGSTPYYLLFPALLAQQPELYEPKMYSEPITVEGTEDAEEQYMLFVIAKDKAGNTSTAYSRYSFVIDRKKPPAPPEPAIAVAKEGKNEGFISWEAIPDYKIFYRFSDNEPFEVYTQPIPFSLFENVGTMEYYLEDRAGNKGSFYRKEFRKPADKGKIVPVFSGVDNGGLYNSSVSLCNLTENGIVRYELSAYLFDPKPVSQFSPILSDKLDFTAAEGEEVTYVVRLRAFPDIGSRYGSEETMIRFSIDRKIPYPPEISGVSENGYYQENQTVALSAPEGTIMVSVSPEAESPSYMPYSNPISLAVEEGTAHQFFISAYVTDKAGNVSSKKNLKIFIDKKIIYVSKQGNDYYPGTRSQPFKTLERALEYSILTGRNTVYLGAGEYDLQSPLVLTRNISIQGGFSGSTWEQNSGKSVIVPGMYFPKNRPLFTVDGATVNFDSLIVRDPDRKVSTFIDFLDGNLTISCVDAELHPGMKQGMSQKNGTLMIKASSFIKKHGEGASLIVIEGGTASISNSLFSTDVASGDVSLVKVVNSTRFDLENSSLNPGSGKFTGALSLTRSIANLKRVTLNAGNAEHQAVALSARESSVFIENSEVRGNASSRMSTAISSFDSNIEISKTTIEASSSWGSVGLDAEDSSITVSYSVIRGMKEQEFLYLIRFDRSGGIFLNNYIFGDEARDYIGISMKNSQSRWLHNTILHGKGKTTEIGCKISGNSFTEVLNTVFLKNASSDGTAFLLDSLGMELTFLGNNIAGFRNFLVVEDQKRTIKSIERFNLLDGDPYGGPFHKNISEAVGKTFAPVGAGEIPRLLPSSQCIDAGNDLGSTLLLETDWFGRKRPNPRHGIKPLNDIGAEEYYND